MLRCLICDDHPMVLSAMAQMLEASWPDLIIETAADYIEAEALAKTGPNVILADLGMPGASPKPELNVTLLIENTVAL